MSIILYSELHAGGRTVKFEGNGGVSSDGLIVTDEGVDGWYSTPDPKIALSERGQGDGAHDITESDILYSARTVSVHCAAIGDNRQALLESIRRVLYAAHRQVSFRLVDDSSDTYVTGSASVSSDGEWHEHWLKFTLTIVCARPERLAWDARRFQLVPAWDSGLGLSYGSGNAGLAYPLSYGRSASGSRNVGVLVNGGSSRAFPVFTVNGPFPSGVRLDFPGLDAGLEFSQPVGVVPLVLDCRSRTASVGGLDVTRHLTRRGFPVVPAGGSVSVSLQSAGSGWVDCLVRDTWM